MQNKTKISPTAPTQLKYFLQERALCWEHVTCRWELAFLKCYDKILPRDGELVYAKDPIVAHLFF